MAFFYQQVVGEPNANQNVLWKTIRNDFVGDSVDFQCHFLFWRKAVLIATTSQIIAVNANLTLPTSGL